jgi:hypothetical protein
MIYPLIFGTDIVISQVMEFIKPLFIQRKKLQLTRFLGVIRQNIDARPNKSSSKISACHLVTGESVLPREYK